MTFDHTRLQSRDNSPESPVVEPVSPIYSPPLTAKHSACEDLIQAPGTPRFSSAPDHHHHHPHTTVFWSPPSAPSLSLWDKPVILDNYPSQQTPNPFRSPMSTSTVSSTPERFEYVSLACSPNRLNNNNNNAFPIPGCVNVAGVSPVTTSIGSSSAPSSPFCETGVPSANIVGLPLTSVPGTPNSFRRDSSVSSTAEGVGARYEFDSILYELVDDDELDSSKKRLRAPEYRCSFPGVSWNQRMRSWLAFYEDDVGRKSKTFNPKKYGKLSEAQISELLQIQDPELSARALEREVVRAAMHVACQFCFRQRRIREQQKRLSLACGATLDGSGVTLPLASTASSTPASFASASPSRSRAMSLRGFSSGLISQDLPPVRIGLPPSPSHGFESGNSPLEVTLPIGPLTGLNSRLPTPPQFFPPVGIHPSALGQPRFSSMALAPTFLRAGVEHVEEGAVGRHVVMPAAETCPMPPSSSPSPSENDNKQSEELPKMFPIASRPSYNSVISESVHSVRLEQSDETIKPPEDTKRRKVSE